MSVTKLRSKIGLVKSIELNKRKEEREKIRLDFRPRALRSSLRQQFTLRCLIVAI